MRTLLSLAVWLPCVLACGAPKKAVPEPLGPPREKYFLRAAPGTRPGDGGLNGLGELLDRAGGLLLPLLDDEDFDVRRGAEGALSWLVWLTDDPSPAKRGLSHPSLEVRVRCRRVLAQYETVNMPSSSNYAVSIELFDKALCPFLWERISDENRGGGLDYVRVLLYEGKISPRQARAILRKTLPEKYKGDTWQDRVRGRLHPYVRRSR